MQLNWCIELLREALALVHGAVPWLFLATGIGFQCAGVFLVNNRAAAPMLESATTLQDPDTVRVVETTIEPPALLPSMRMPLEGVPVPTAPSALPGARRAYRGGVHEGVDFRCAPGMPVRAALDGYVLAIQDEPNLPRKTRNELLAHCARTQLTPGVVLDVLHGKRVVLCHGVVDGRLLTTSYSHLEGIREDFAPGMRVEAGEVIAAAGNTGTSHAYGGDGWAELHFEIRLDGEPLGLGLSPREAGALYRAAFAEVTVP